MVKEIPNWPGYLIYSDGRVWSNKSNKFLSPQPNIKGYQRVCLSNGSKKQCVAIHRLVAEAFIENTDPKKTEVNHKDENIYNNDISNLEWVTSEDNLKYGTRIKRITKANSKAMAQYTIGGRLVAIYTSDTEAARINGLNRSGINNCVRGKSKSSGGYVWKRVEDEE